MATVLPKQLAAAAPEVAVYLKESVGNSTRIDYGTGTQGPLLLLLPLQLSLPLLLVPAWHNPLSSGAFSPLCPGWALGGLGPGAGLGCDPPIRFPPRSCVHCPC